MITVEHFKKIKISLPSFFLIMLGFFMLSSIASCSKDDNSPVPITDKKNKEQGNTSSEKTVFHLTFEKGNEEFFSAISHDARDISPDLKIPVRKVTEDKYNCGELFIGRASNFTKWKGKDFKGSQEYDFKGNTTTFLGLNMGACKGQFVGVATKSFKLEKNVKKRISKISFIYYRPGDFTGWKDRRTYRFYVLIYKKEETEKPYLGFSPRINPSGWTDFSKKLTKDLPKGDYFLVVKISGGSAAIDNIKIVE